MNEKTSEIRLVEEYINDLLDREKYDEIKLVDHVNGSWSFKPREVIEAYYTITRHDILIHVEDNNMVADFPASEIKTVIRFKKIVDDLNDTMKIINREKNYKSVILYNSLGQSLEFEKIISIEEDHDINPELIIIVHTEHFIQEGRLKQCKKKLYLYDNNITGIEFTG